MRLQNSQQRLGVLWERLRTSFWFVPMLMALFAGVLVWLAHILDLSLTGRPPEEIPAIVYISAPDNAREVISTLLSSMITMTSLVFSITMVVLTLAASQFGPRLIRSFMSSPHTQFVLGSFVMTTVYCLLVLGVIGSRSTDKPQAFASVSLAIALALLSVGLLVVFLHFLARSIVSETVIERVGREIDVLLNAFEPVLAQDSDASKLALPADFDQRASSFGPIRSGYVEGVEFGQIVEAAQRADVLIMLSFRAGDFVVVDGAGIKAYPSERCTDELKAAVQNAIVVGPHRTPNQDPEFSIRHLVEIAVRALSPGINDPYTATAVLSQLSASLSSLMTRALPEGYSKDEAGHLRLICPRPTYSSMIGASFNQIRQNGSDKPLVVIHMIEAITRIADHARLPAQFDALEEQLDAILAAGKRDIADAIDKQAMMSKAEAARRSLSRRGAPA